MINIPKSSNLILNQLSIPRSLAEARKIFGAKFTLFSFLETLRRAGEVVEIEAESGRFLLALSDLSVYILGFHNLKMIFSQNSDSKV